MFSIYPNGTTINDEFHIEEELEECPVCLKAGDPKIIESYTNLDDDHVNPRFQVVFQCPSNKCKAYFIGQYQFDDNRNFLELVCLAPAHINIRQFSRIIENISPNFKSIYNQAYTAHQSKLTDIAGAGYRRALEFLIKDFILLKVDESMKVSIIKQHSLQKLIDVHLSDATPLKKVVERAWWLGNDLTHYEQTWVGKDLNELVKIINLVVHWIEIVIEAEELIMEMPK
jgi:hypothetical protein